MDTDFLFAQPSLMSGMARTFDLFGLFDSYNQSLTGAEADRRALYCDFAMVGQDLISAMNEFVAKHTESGESGKDPAPAQYSFVFDQGEGKKHLGA
jgi:hypothetical protein